jgi:hypothetical protein
MDSALVAARSKDGALDLLAKAIRDNGRALERMPYPLVKEMERLASDLEIASWQAEDGFLPASGPILAQVDDWLRKLPRDAA